MAVVVVQPVPAETPPAVQRVLASAGLATRTLMISDDEDPFADLSGVDGLLILGGPRSAPSDTGLFADTPHSALIRDALAAEVPVLAFGAGARFLAKDRGRATHTGSGGTPGAEGTVRFTAAAGADPVFGGTARPSPGLRPALDTLELPAGAVVLACSEGYPEQAFRVGASAWGVRFLPPATTWAEESPSDLALDPWGEELLGRFAALVVARAEHTATRAFFTRRADAWEERFAYQTPAYEAGVSRMRLAPGGLALDLGCGTGRAMAALRAQVGPEGRVLGIDVTPAMLAAAARHGRTRDGQLLAADCTQLPLPRASVRGIFSAGLLDHLPDPHAALGEWARVTAPEGVLVLFHPSGRAERAARHGRTLDPDDLLAEDNLRTALEATGWQLEEYEDAAGHFLARAVPRAAVRPHRMTL
ncbi:methyltransferase domain-containing protein [Streptomyces sp. NPDC096136]|uniref:methyltransferase domain-containing protein n=1 Tax=Streptomyces sp. NPDC096136 TaxID=3366076 RepID=UPI00382296F2